MNKKLTALTLIAALTVGVALGATLEQILLTQNGNGVQIIGDIKFYVEVQNQYVEWHSGDAIDWGNMIVGAEYTLNTSIQNVGTVSVNVSWVNAAMPNGWSQHLTPDWNNTIWQVGDWKELDLHLVLSSTAATGSQTWATWITATQVEPT